MNVNQRLIDLEIEIPEMSKPLADYVPAVKTGEYIFISGQLPIVDGDLIYSGKIGKNLSLGEGKDAARIACINCLAALKSKVSLEDVEQIVKVTGYVQCGEDFIEHPQVINGASELLGQIFGDKGTHSRAAVGVNSLPLNAPCEVEMIVKIK
ncbi:Hypothetical protein SYNTR_0422 [Candidatus Syntrophocurvum alkaliphilum]|uniref:Endoribonuclease L-PSP/chorismate mutase-like domain-containing protein n=1 Tax=Candidatus Syntrophocurvum alkaliphilum TaxID=2293317 RepID=A0A6I6DCH8_9FIRM|nr:RidA family protein [Candidatus Syntrophocurvum alkaliphilum]QGT99015.1 Hypothetical protein SYNTR_0422 [Candidatus Syntrophocurvum alkaliphilum]